MIVTTRFPGPSFCATCSAPVTFAPDDEPPRMPSSHARRATIANACGSGTMMISFASVRLSTAGTNDEPMPSTSCGPAWPPPIAAPCGPSTRPEAGGVLLAQEARRAGERAAGAAAADEGVDAAVHLLPDLRRRRLVMRLAVVDVLELLRHVRALDPARELLGLGNGAAHAGVLRREHDLAAEGFHDLALLGGEMLGDAEDHAIAHAHAGEREADAGVARGRLDDRAAFFQEAVALGVGDHADADAVLDGAAGVEELELHEDVLVNARKLKHRRVADEVEEVAHGLGKRADRQGARIVYESDSGLAISDSGFAIRGAGRIANR